MKYIISAILLSITLVLFAQVEKSNPQPIKTGIWVFADETSSSRINSLIVEEDSTITLVDLPKSKEKALELSEWISSNFNKPIGQLILSASFGVDSTIIEIFNPMVIHSFNSVFSMLGGAELLEERADISTKVGSFAIYDATPRMSMLYPGYFGGNNSLIVFSHDDNIAYLSNLSLDKIKRMDASRKKAIKASIKYIKTNTQNCEYYITRNGKVGDADYLNKIEAELD
jgi:hypothetical protein